MDGSGPRQEVRTGPSQQLHHYKQPGISPTMEVFSRSRPELDFCLRDTQPSICAQMRRDMSQESHGDIASSYLDADYDIPVVESFSPLIISSAIPPPVVGTLLRSVTPSNRSLIYLQSGPFDQPQCYWPLARVSSSDLLSYVEPLPLDQLVFHSADTVRSWPAAVWNELLAVAHRDMAVARRNLADLTLYLDNQSTHLAAALERWTIPFH